MTPIPRIVATISKQLTGSTADHFCGAVLDCIIPHVGTGLIWAAAIFTDNPAIEIMAGAFTGALAMGWGFAAAAEKGTRADVFRRCGIHGCFGLFWGIFLAYHYGGPDGPFPHVPFWALAGLTAGLAGAAMVTIVPYIPKYGGVIIAKLAKRWGVELPTTVDEPAKPMPDIPGDETPPIR